MNPMSAYGVVHYLLRKQFGPARDQTCASCHERPAIHWAYDHLDVFERFDPETNQVFSVNFDHYQATCQRCHKRLDLANVGRIRDALAKARAKAEAA